MAIVNTALTTTPAILLNVPAGKKYAITTLLVCNTATDDGTGTNDSGFDMYIIPNGQSASNTNIVLKNLSVSASDTFTFNVERIILEESDQVVLVGKNPTNLSATISYLEV